MDVFTIYNNEKGIGITTLSVTLAKGLAMNTKSNVLLVDFSPNCDAINTLAESFDCVAIEKKYDCEREKPFVFDSIYQCMIKKQEDEVQEDIQEVGNLFVLPIHQQNGGTSLDKCSFQRIMYDLREKIRVVIVDTSSIDDISLYNVILSTNYVIFPINKYPSGFESYKEFNKILDSVRKELGDVITTKIFPLGFVRIEAENEGEQLKYWERERLFETELHKAKSEIDADSLKEENERLIHEILERRRAIRLFENFKLY